VVKRRSSLVGWLAVAAAVVLALPVGAVAKGGPPSKEDVTNNLSFPAIAVDTFSINPMTAPSFTVTYEGDYPGLTDEEIALVEASGPWYPQKLKGNAWQADYEVRGTEAVTYVDWGDNVESVSPTVRRPFRLEVVLFKDLVETTMTGYTMAVLEYPSSANELQGAKDLTYESRYATVISAKPKFVIQYFGSPVPSDLTWTGTQWSFGTVKPISFAPELNVGGKYIYGASEGGWKPLDAGWYRLTFYVPSGSGVNLRAAEIGNYADLFGTIPEPPEGEVVAEAEGGGAVPVVDGDNNLTYVDVYVKPRK
jgi:hypothetical protein